jgi:beta-glucosidase
MTTLVPDHVFSKDKIDDQLLYLDPSQPIERRIDDLIARMTLKEKIGQLNVPRPKELGRELDEQLSACKLFARGDLLQEIGPAGGFFTMGLMLEQGPRQQAEFMNELQRIAVQETRLKIPLIIVEEGTHGCMTSGATIFPEGPALGSTWDMDLIEDIYHAVARETRAIGSNHLCTLVIEPIRDPRLGRNVEAYSEDPYQCARIAEAIVRGNQGDELSDNDRVVSILCHFPGQSQPFGGMERGTMEISERTLYSVYMPAWEAGIKKCGALSVMATYPAVDDVPVHASSKYLTRILRQELDFQGHVVSEGAGLGTLLYEGVAEDMKQAGQMAINAGVDVSIWYEEGFLAPMVSSVREGSVSMQTIDQAVRRVLRVKFLLGLFEQPFVDVDRAEKIVHCQAHQELALNAAREGVVLLKNENNLLPLERDIHSIAVIGPNADAGRNQLGDYVANKVLQDVVTVLDGIRSTVSSETRVRYVKGCEIMGDTGLELNAAQKAAGEADVAIVVVGEDEHTVGEPNDVASLDLLGHQEELIKTVYETGTPTIVVLINGRPLSINWTAEHVPAILEAWMCGEKGGQAIAEILFGEVNPSGKLTCTFPRHSGQLPMYYNYKPSKKYWLENAWAPAYVDLPPTPLFEFGYGLSYTTFQYSDLEISPKSTGPYGEIQTSLEIRNTGQIAGAEVVQLYINDVISSVTTPVRELKGFEKVWLNPGESKRVEFTLSFEHLFLYNQYMEREVEPGIFEVMVGSSCNDIRLEDTFTIEN